MTLGEFSTISRRVAIESEAEEGGIGVRFEPRARLRVELRVQLKVSQSSRIFGFALEG